MTGVSDRERTSGRMGEIHDRLVDRLMKHAQKIFGNAAMPEALDEFMLWPEDGKFWDDAENHVQLFYLVKLL